jgi:membrane protease YdiL (CAAX protease family)
VSALARIAGAITWTLLDGDGLRAGWRLLGHLALLLTFGAASVAAAIGLFALADALDIARPKAAWAGLVYQSILLFVPLVAAHLVSAWLLDARWRGPSRGPGTLRGVGLGPPVRAVVETLGGAVLGAALLGLTVAAMALGGASVAPGAFRAVDWLAWTVVILLAASVEELLFRGYAFAWFGASIARLLEVGGRLIGLGPGRWRGVIAFAVVGAASAVLFGIAHVSNPSAAILSTVNTVLAGVWLTVLVLRTRTLTWAIGAHLGWNHAQALVLGTPLSGLGPEQLGAPMPSFVTITLSGPAWWSGGAYGPEGSAATTAALFVGIALSFALPRRRPDQASLGLVPSELVAGSASAPASGTEPSSPGR